MPASFQHETVLRGAVIEHLAFRAGGARVGGVFLDGTLGGGGHAEGLLEATPGSSSVVGIDRDPAALAAARTRLAPFGARFRAVHGTYADMSSVVADLPPLAGIVLDLGVSSPQLDHADRGFSFQKDGPVDMRMDSSQGPTAAELIEATPEDELTTIIGRLGEEPRARRIARAVKAGAPWTSTVALADTVARASGYRNSRTHPATRTFQALRMAVNDELGQLERGLAAALPLLAPGGRLAIISFHSLEDRAVKQRFRTWAGVGTPRDAYGHPITPPLGRDVVRKGIAGSKVEPENPRARSARLRVFEKTGELAATHDEPASPLPPAPTGSDRQDLRRPA
jgi:16S rRNA (cytosine1402-N4)-methyltransferase